MEPKNQTVGQGTNVEIRCEVFGTPRPTIKWTKVGESLNSSIDASNPILRLYNVQPRDRGTYICVGSNVDTFVQGSATLEVEGESHPLKKKENSLFYIKTFIAVREPPRIELYPQEIVTVNVGHSAQIQCRVTAGQPQPTIRWFRDDGRPITNVEEFPGGVLR